MLRKSQVLEKSRFSLSVIGEDLVAQIENR
ncbi:MAG: hypothetical protein QOH31_2593 [Verrucomicrobiota bacterium]|jgi:hypothetical protein